MHGKGLKHNAKKQKSLLKGGFLISWSGRQDLNLRPPHPQFYGVYSYINQLLTAPLTQGQATTLGGILYEKQLKRCDL